MKQHAILCLLLTSGWLGIITCEDHVGADESRSEASNSAAISVAELRTRAQLLHDLIHQSLLAVHEHYYREDESLPLPAAVFRGLFVRFGQKHNVSIRWLAVEVEPMNLDHRPRTEFEKAAAEALKQGADFFEASTEKSYEYAGTIPMTSECLKCHVPNRTSLRDRRAGLVITIPRG